MSSKYVGAAALLKEEYPLAVYVHCASHRLDLCVAASCENQSFNIMVGVSGMVVGGARGPLRPLNRGANGDKGAPKLFACNIFG